MLETIAYAAAVALIVGLIAYLILVNIDEMQKKVIEQEREARKQPEFWEEYT